jgi:alcohol dehydrogenase class IV
MAKKEYSAYQKQLIKDYYQNMDTIMLQKLQELVTELYLNENKTKKDKLWARVDNAMQKLNIPKSIAANIMAKKDVKILAENLNNWLKAKP